MKLQEKQKKQAGITLVALVVTIIILIILATISIRMVIGEGGLIWQANNAKVEYRAATVDEEVLSWKAEKQVAEFNDKVQPQTRDELIDDQLARGLLTPEEAEDAKDDGKVKIGSRVIDYGEDGGVPSIPDGGDGQESQEGTIRYSNFNWPDEGSKAEVTVNQNGENSYTMAYQVYDSINAETPKNSEWTPIENGGIVKDLTLGNVVKTALTDGKGHYGKTADFTVTDTVAPKAEVSFNSETTNTDGFVEATVKLIDNQSGIDLSKCKWVYNTSSSTKLSEESYTEEFQGEQIEDIKLTLKTEIKGKYYLHILSVDKAGKKTEKQYGPITVNQLAKSISLSETQKTIETADTFKLTATVEPSNATNQEVIWSAEPSGIVSLKESGKTATVAGVKEGQTTITVKLKENENIKAECVVTVNKGKYTSVKLEVGDYVKFEYINTETSEKNSIPCMYIRSC